LNKKVGMHIYDKKKNSALTICDYSNLKKHSSVSDFVLDFKSGPPHYSRH